MSKTWKKGGRTYDSDRYRSIYRVYDDRFYKSVWEESPFVGPGAYNRSNVDLVRENKRNDVNNVLDSTNPFFRARATLSSDRVKFTP